MKLALVTALLAIVLIPGASAIEPGSYLINLQASLLDKHDDTEIYALYNRPTYPDRLGTGFIRCEVLSANFADCSISLRLGRGQVVGRAVLPRQASFRQYALTGGTGLYANSGGIISVVPLVGKVFRIVAEVQAF